MTLWLLRHGEAEPRARSDAERPLTEYGRKDVRRSAEHLRGRPLTHILATVFGQWPLSIAASTWLGLAVAQ